MKGENQKTNAMSIQKFNYQDSAISVEVNGKIMVNATEMAKQFGKRPAEWLRYQEAKDYITALSEVLNHTSGDLLIVKKGNFLNDTQGTWMERKLAIRFAQWLDPYFAVAIDQHLEGLMNKPTRLKPELAVPDDLPNVSKDFLFLPKNVVIDGYPIRRVEINNKYYYCLVDIQRAAGMGEYRSQLGKVIYKSYTFKIRTKANSKLASYIDNDGIDILLSRSSIKSAKLFLAKFIEYTSPFNSAAIDYKKFDYDRLLQIIVKTKDEKDRNFLFEMYNILKAEDKVSAEGGAAW